MDTVNTDRKFVLALQPQSSFLRYFRKLDSLCRRALDIVASVVGLILLFPFFIFIAFTIKFDSPGPIFYWGKRVGRGGKDFMILKFRTMYESQKSYEGPKVTAQGDVRVTPVGQWLRSTKINELPQLWNVLRGDMSLVGPRPEDPEIAKSWPEDVRRELFSVRPGITSPASIIYRDEEALLKAGSVMDDYLRGILPTKLRLDQLYIRNQNFFSDLDVIFWTFVVLIPQARKENIPEAKLYWGPFSVFVAHDFRWFLLDFIVSMGCVAGVGIIWRTITPLNIGWQYAPMIALAMAFVFSLTNAIGGLNRVYWTKAHPSETLDLLISSIVATGLLWLADQLLLIGLNVPPGLFIFGGIVVYLGFVGIRYRERILTGLATRWLRWRTGSTVIGERLLIVGAGELGQFASWLVRKANLAQAFTIVGMVDDDPRKQGMRIDGVKVLGLTSDIQQFVEKQDIGIVLFAISNIEPQERLRIMTLCNTLSVRTVYIPNVVETMREEFSFDSSKLKRPSSSQISTKHLTNWLQNLETLLEQKNYGAVQMEIEHLRTELMIRPHE